MKTKLTLLLIPLNSNLMAQANFERIIKDEIHSSVITLTKETVRCSALGYGGAELKITLPSLKWNAIFDHSNNDGRGPCVTAGMSFCGLDNFSFPTSLETSEELISDQTNKAIPDVLLDESRKTEEITVNVKLREEFTIQNDKCNRVLRELVETNVRGIDFTHTRVKSIGELSLEECSKIF